MNIAQLLRSDPDFQEVHFNDIVPEQQRKCNENTILYTRMWQDFLKVVEKAGSVMQLSLIDAESNDSLLHLTADSSLDCYTLASQEQSH